MTTLKVTLNDQRLIAEERLVIASGDINSVFIEVTFDETWDLYPHRYATFETTAMNGEPIEIVLDAGKGVVPPEVVENPGILLVGVWASSLDGKEAKTSTFAKYKISQGARRSVTTLTPTMDLYRQFLSALNDKFSPIHDAFQERLNGFIKEYETTLEIAMGRLMGNSAVAKVKMDTYKGDGTYGIDHPTKVSSPRKPAMVLVTCPNDDTPMSIVIHCNGKEIPNSNSVYPAYRGSGHVCIKDNSYVLDVVVRQTSKGDGTKTFDTYDVEWCYTSSRAETNTSEYKAKLQGNTDGVEYSYTIVYC